MMLKVGLICLGSFNLPFNFSTFPILFDDLLIFGSCCMILFFFVLARSQVNLLRYLTQESYVPTSMLCTRIRLTMRLGVTFTFLKFLALFDTATWRHFSHQLVWFSLAFTLDSFSRTARTRSHVQCWQLSSLGIDLNSDIHKLCKSIIWSLEFPPRS